MSLLLLALGASSLLLLQRAHAQTPLPGNQLPVPARTHTFASYLGDPVIKPLVPVYVSTVGVVRSYADVSVIVSCARPLIHGMGW